MLAGRMPFTALVVEDEWILRSEIVEKLKAQGWHVIEASTGEAALNPFDMGQIDILFTDIQLGGELSGWDVAEALRATWPDLAVIYTSGNSADRSRQVSRGLFFDKPYDAFQIVEACHVLLAAPVDRK
jgi:CheY-like chemotaxis protein